MANPRKFSEKIALHNQKQAEETAAFERIMQEVSVTRVVPPQGSQPPRFVTHLQPHAQPYMRPYLGGSLPNVNQIAANPQMELRHLGGFDESKHLSRHPARFDSRMRPYAYAHKRAIPLELSNRHRMGQIDGPPGQYAGPYLSPPPESNWRRTNSDSALHQSVMNPNPQDTFNPNNPAMDQARRDFNENNMQHSYKTMLDKKLAHHLQSGNRPKSCETSPNISLLPAGGSHPVMGSGEEGNSMPLCGNGTAPTGPSPMGHGLSHVTQIGNNTGSLPDLSNFANLHIPSPLSNPIDYDDSLPHQPAQQQAVGVNSSLCNQARSTSNIPAASAISPHLSGLSRGPASPNRSRRHTHNGPSPLSLGSPEHIRRMKYSTNATSPKVGVKPELKSPPVPSGYSYPYSQSGNPAGNWPHSSSEHPGSPSHGQTMPSYGVPQGSSGGGFPQQLRQQQTGGQLRIDVSAASKIGQPPSSYPRTHPGASVTSPLTSPTSPTSHCSQASFSPVTSPRHEFTTGSNPALSEAYYRTDMSSMHPLQQKFEQFHVVGNNSSSHHHSGAPPMYSNLAALNENSVDGAYDLHGHSGSMMHGMNDGRGMHSQHDRLSKIPHIVLTGADDPNFSKTSGLVQNDFNSALAHDLGSDYFSSEDLKANLGIEGLQMLEESNIISDPAMEDSLHLDSL